MEELKKGGSSVLVLDGGNLLFSKPVLRDFEREQLTLKAATLIKALNAMGCDGVSVGPLDFAAGLPALLDLYKAAKFPILCANLVWADSGRPVFRPYTVTRRAGLTVGVIGVMDPTSNVASLGSSGSRVSLLPLQSAIRSSARLLRAEGCDVVVVLSSVDPKRIRVLARSAGDVDLFIGGDPGGKLMIPFVERGIMLAGGSQLGKHVGDVELRRPGASRSGPEMKHRFVPMKLERRDDPKIKRIVDGYYRAIVKLRKENAARYVKEMEESVNLANGSPVFVSASECGGCHRPQYDRWRASKHAKAYASLPETARHQTECVECHVTGFGKWGGYSETGSGPDLGGVQCEECHGPGSSHPATPIARNGSAAAKECKRCHTRTRSPEFNLKTYMAKIGCGKASL